MNQCEGQIDIFDFINEKRDNFKIGEWIEKENVGREISFDEIANMVGQLIVMDYSTSSHEWYKVVKVEKIVQTDDTPRRLIFYDGCKQRGIVSEMYFDENCPYSRARAYLLKNI